jgi:hypothetical protein
MAAEVASRTLAPSLVGVAVSAWCPGDSRRQPAVWVCARDLGDAMEVVVGGEVPALVPLFEKGGLPLEARVTVAKEVFAR